MNDKPTPETDKAIKESNGQWSFVLKETCQRLERERDELQSLLVLVINNGTDGMALIDQKASLDFLRHVPSECASVKRERDEARERAAKWESSSDAMERAGEEQARRADENREWALKAERERDEAMDKYAAEATDHMLAVNKLCNERDEAREQLSAAKHFLEKYIAERDEARIAIISTLEKNRHLADGDDCTLAKLKSVVPEWK